MLATAATVCLAACPRIDSVASRILIRVSVLKLVAELLDRSFSLMLLHQFVVWKAAAVKCFDVFLISHRDFADPLEFWA